jgi:hypothetical protein
MSSVDRVLWTPLNNRLRWALMVTAVVSALAHIPVIGEHLHEAPYMGLEFIVLTVACLAIGVTVVWLDSLAVYALAGATCGLAVIGYALTRLIAFPLLGDDVGNWFEPLGVVAVSAELLTVEIALIVLLGASHGRLYETAESV